MNREVWVTLEKYMLKKMKTDDMAHDKLHIYRVLNYALQLVEAYPEADKDVVITAVMLHDIGRKKAEKTGKKHAKTGAKMACHFLKEHGFSDQHAEHVSSCIRTHSFSGKGRPETLEAEIVFDADKLDLIGTVGVARAIVYGSKMQEPFYQLGQNRMPMPGALDEPPSLIREYQRKLERLSLGLLTPKAKEIAGDQQEEMNRYFESFKKEVEKNHQAGKILLEQILTDA